MTLKKSYIYALVEGNTKNYRYVGKSVTPEKRMKRHVSLSKLKKTHKDMWIQSVLKNNKKIELIILEETNEKEWPEKEKFWIKKLKEEGFDLTNHNNGGLGGGHIIYKKTFEEVKLWVQKNTHAYSASSWYKIVRNKSLPDFIPGNPKEVYLKRGWVSWGDFLDTDNKYDNDVNYISYIDAKEYIKKNLFHINTSKVWKDAAKKTYIPKNIPNRPERYYKKRGWKGWGDFLNTGRVANKNKNFDSYEEAKKYSKKLKIDSSTKWRKHCLSGFKSENIPSNPDKEYKNKGWISWPKFFD